MFKTTCKFFKIHFYVKSINHYAYIIPHVLIKLFYYIALPCEDVKYCFRFEAYEAGWYAAKENRKKVTSIN